MYFFDRKRMLLTLGKECSRMGENKSFEFYRIQDFAMKLTEGVFSYGEVLARMKRSMPPLLVFEEKSSQTRRDDASKPKAYFHTARCLRG